MTAQIVWFREDLRLADNPALHAAAENGGPMVGLFILEESATQRALGGATKWWLHHSLTALQNSLRQRNIPLLLARGATPAIIMRLAEEIKAKTVLWNRRYAPADVAIDTQIKADLKEAGIDVQSFNANLLHEPWEIATKTGKSYQVFTPYWKACLARGEPPAPLKAPRKLQGLQIATKSDSLQSWELLPTQPNWARGFADHWSPGEKGAHRRLQRFLSKHITGYAAARDLPDGETTSGLSPHLRWGEISPRQIWAAARAKTADDTSADTSKFFAELGWRDFSKSLLFYAPDLAGQNLKPQFDAFPWQNAPQHFKAWCEGRTGYPLVDAGMRQLWRSGWMHNRVRMVAASFLIKHLLVDWRHGEQWFWDTLVDADAASNPASWQWVAGCGADAAPFFRIFNPVAQSEKFDPDGAYIRTWVPELAALGSGAIHAPWLAPEGALAAAGVALGNTYPFPIVGHLEARKAALAAYQGL